MKPQEIKFRARHKSSGKWFRFTFHELVLVMGTWMDIDYEEHWEHFGRYVGIQDKHGTEIYEGDIIDFDNLDIGGSKVCGEVVFNTDQTLGDLGWCLWTERGYMRTDFLGSIEIVGSVHEGGRE